MLTADYWYHHSDDPQPERRGPQMSGPAETLTDVTMTTIALRDQGYVIQRVEVRDVCGTCDGAGRTRKHRKFQPCRSCAETGVVGAPRVFTTFKE